MMKIFFHGLAVLVLLIKSVSANSLDNITIAQSHKITSGYLNEERTFYVSLPKGYSDTSYNYPVVILLDGEQNLEHTVASSRMLSNWKGVPEVIIIAIKSGNRIKDFTPSLDRSYSKDSGQAKAFSKFIREELMPFVDSKYRTHSFRVLIGHSISGTYALSQLLTQNNFYSAYIVTGPALWWNSRELLKKAETDWASKIKRDKPVFLGIGALDGYDMKKDLQRFESSVALNKSIFLKSEIYSEEGHMSATLPSVYDGLTHVFKGARFSKDYWEEFTSEDFVKFIFNSKKIFGEGVKQPAELLIGLAEYLIGKEDYAGAITVLTENLKQYPENLFNYSELANVYALNNQPKLAIELYKKGIKKAISSSSNRVGQIDLFKKQIDYIEQEKSYLDDELQRFEGCFQSESGSQFQYFIDNGKLKARRKGWNDFRLFPTEENKFQMRVQPRLTFEFQHHQVSFHAQGKIYIYNKVDCANSK